MGINVNGTAPTTGVGDSSCPLWVKSRHVQRNS